MNINNTDIAKLYGVSSASIGNWKKAEDSKRHLYNALLEYYKKNELGCVDAEFYITFKDKYITYNTIRDNEPLFAMFEKDSLNIIGMSAELENDIEEIRHVVHNCTKPAF